MDISEVIKNIRSELNLSQEQTHSKEMMIHLYSTPLSI